MDPDGVAAANESRRVADVVAAAHGSAWAADLEAYREYLAAGRAIAPATARMYVSAAAALLRSSGVSAAAELTQRHLARHLRHSPGRRTNLLRFLSWVAARSGQGFEPGPDRRTPPRKRERATMRKARILLDRLAAARSERERGALVAATIAVVQGLSLKEVLVLRRSSGTGGEAVAVTGSGMVVELAEPLAGAFGRINARARGTTFGGRNGVQPLTASAVRHHVRKSSGGRPEP